MDEQHSRTPALQAWARAELDLGDGVFPEQVWLARLAESDMVPAQDEYEAFATLLPALDAPDEVPPAYLAARRATAAERVSDLASSGFFKLTPEQRRARIAELKPTCDGTSSAAVRLSWLAAAADAQLPETPPADREVSLSAEKLAGRIAPLFLLQPPFRATARRRLFPNEAEWAQAARKLRRDYPQIASLLPRLVERLATARKRSQQTRSRQNQHARRERKRNRQWLKQTQQEEGASWGHAWWVLLLVLVIGRLVLQADRELDRPPRYELNLPSDSSAFSGRLQSDETFQQLQKQAEQMAEQRSDAEAHRKNIRRGIEVTSIFLRAKERYRDLRSQWLANAQTGGNAVNLAALEAARAAVAQLQRDKAEVAQAPESADGEDLLARMDELTREARFDLFLMQHWQAWTEQAAAEGTLPITIPAKMEDSPGKIGLAWTLLMPDETGGTLLDDSEDLQEKSGNDR